MVKNDVNAANEKGLQGSEHQHEHLLPVMNGCT